MWGWILRIVVAVSAAFVPLVVTSVTPLVEHGAEVQKAAQEGPGQWQTWWWVCLGGQVVFLPFIFAMAGRWSPRRAREDAEEHQRAVERELAALESRT
ncbi:hypothetical protein AB0M44_30765 [Streptosporangium subroseum]|uniref:hypothetical protein n=1 Tax=Streptosporangium subroseum TaxID=106412 RepID=UPI00343A7EAD